MPFTAHDLRYHPEESYPQLYAYLHRNAQRYLGGYKYDAFEVDTVIGHVVEQLVRLGLFGAGDTTPKTALDSLTEAQFYAFLNRTVRNKAIDRLRKRRVQVSPAAEFGPFDEEGDEDPLSEAVTPLWGETSLATPEDIAVHLASQRDLRNMLKHCIKVLGAAPHQLQAVVQELREFGCDELLKSVLDELHVSLAAEVENNPHMSQHKDHAHKKLRHCLQERSTNLTVVVALRLCEYKQQTSTAKEYSVDIQTLAQHDLSDHDVRVGLQELVAEGLLDWHGEDHVRLTAAQVKSLARFYREE